MPTTTTPAPGSTARIRITRNLRSYLRQDFPVGSVHTATYAEYAPYADARNPRGAHWLISTGPSTRVAVFPNQCQVV